jgi:hypothetical protein
VECCVEEAGYSSGEDEEEEEEEGKEERKSRAASVDSILSLGDFALPVSAAAGGGARVIPLTRFLDANAGSGAFVF